MITTVTSASMSGALLNLRNHSLLNSVQELSPLESIAHLATFENVPVFGGVEFRNEMLSRLEAVKAAESDLTTKVLNAVTKTSKTVSCHALNLFDSTVSFVLRKESRLSYGSFCEELPPIKKMLLEPI